MNKAIVGVVAGLVFVAAERRSIAEEPVKREPVSKGVFESIADYYGYDRSLPLEAKTIGVWPHRAPYVIEKVAFGSTHGERVSAFFTHPKEANGKRLPAILLLHGNNDFWGKSEDWALDWMDILSREGWCVLVADCYGFGERKKADTLSWDEMGPYTRRDRLIQAVTDYRRGLDYLCSRAEVDASKVALLGGSMGGYHGTLVAGLEDRFRAVALTVVGAWPEGATDDRFLRFGHTLNFAPRISAPVLMVNATGDGREGGEELFRVMPEPKQQIWYEHGHYMPPREFSKDIVSWLHKHLD
ncbi:MAG: alpha/beta fold hydrolase [Phycisphaerae bacterium]|nr:alpha/beta fold hydrolase [Phycisphaerae bacterium]